MPDKAAHADSTQSDFRAQETTRDSEVAQVTVRLGAVIANYKTFQNLASPASVAAVVKADAYGLGAQFVSSAIATRTKCDTLFVARLEEGIALRPVVPAARIFVLDGARPDSVPALMSSRLTPVLNSLADIAAWGAAAAEAGHLFDAALHVDTGMNRLGIPPGELAVLVAESRKRLMSLRVVLVMSHLACADDPDSKLNAIQLDRFRAVLAMLPSAPASLASSGGVLLGRDYAFDMVRPGLGLYGGNPQPTKDNPFAVVARLTGRVLQIRRVDKGESVGYGATFTAKRPTVIATVALGYADGLMRAIGNRGSAAVAGARVPVIGRVSMDLATLDCTDVKGVQPGSEVEFLGDVISLEEVAAAARTASYEILTSLSARAPRQYLESER
jgi:alanine racemase